MSQEIERLFNAIAKGYGDPAVLGTSTTLNEERKSVLAELDRVPAATE
ncbi:MULTISPECIES: hypothetical protein [unclassified Mesorhizobium]|nr:MULTISPECIES: hypothetical protein [unclassified Mesorhizobium]